MITDGGPTIPGNNAAQLVKEGEQSKAFSFYAVGVEGANFDVLRQIAVKEPLKLKGLQFRELFAWLSSSLSSVSKSTPGERSRFRIPPHPDGWAVAG